MEATFTSGKVYEIRLAGCYRFSLNLAEIHALYKLFGEIIEKQSVPA